MVPILFHPRVLVVLALAFGVAYLTRAWRLRAQSILTEQPDHPSVPAELRRGERTWVLFTTPWCATCSVVQEMLGTGDPSTPVVTVDASERPDLAADFSVRTSPTVLLTDGEGTVVDRLVGAGAVRARLATTAA